MNLLNNYYKKIFSDKNILDVKNYIELNYSEDKFILYKNSNKTKIEEDCLYFNKDENIYIFNISKDKLDFNYSKLIIKNNEYIYTEGTLNKYNFLSEIKDFNHIKPLKKEELFLIEKNTDIYKITKKEKLFSKFIYIFKDKAIINFYNHNILSNISTILNLKEEKEEKSKISIEGKEIIYITFLPHIANKIKVYSIDISYKRFIVIIDGGLKRLNLEEKVGDFLHKYKNKNYYYIRDIKSFKNVVFENYHIEDISENKEYI